MRDSSTGLTIGVSLFVPKAGISFWSNGAAQNTLYLWQLLRAMPGVEHVVIINGGDGEHPPHSSLPPEYDNAEFVRIGEVVDKLDVLIESGAQVAAADVAKVRERGGVAITYKFGNAIWIDAERAIFGKSAGAIFNGARFDECWTTLQHAPTCGPYWETCYRCPVRVLPHIWEPAFVDAACRELIARGVTPGYQVRKAKKRIAVLEPNLSPIKASHVPMLISEQAFRKRPELIERVMVTNAEHMRGHLSFSTFAKALDICHTNADDGMPVCSFEARWNTPTFMAQHADVAVSHQVIAVPNYALYDLTYLGYPVVHNVPAMREAGVGFYYEGYDAIAGGHRLIDAMTTYDARLEEHRDAGDRFLDGVLATSLANVQAHADALARTFAVARAA